MAAGRRIIGWPWAAAVAVLAAVLVAGPAFSVPQGQRLADRFLTTRPAGMSDNPDRPPPLTHADDDMVSELIRARTLLEKKDYNQAIRNLQTLIERGRGFVPAPDGRQWASLWAIANELIGEADEAARKLYRRLYEAQAQQMYEQGLATGDLRMLKRVAHLYLHTAHGCKALDTLGRLHFDHGRFLEAADAWTACLKLEPEETRPLLLARLAVAQHLSGRLEEARQRVAELARKYPQAQAELSGRMQKVAEFAQAATQLPAPPPPAVVQPAGWPGLGALVDGVGLMTESKVVLVPKWRVPDMPTVSGEDIGEKLVALKSMQRSVPGQRAMGIKVVKGHVQLEPPRNMPMYDYSGSARVTTSYLPPMLQPVVIGDVLIVRQDDAVTAYNIFSGEKMWAGRGRMTKDRPNQQNVYYGYIQPSDCGQYTLTAGGGCVYAITNYNSSNLPRHFFGPNQQQPSDTSCLTAYSIHEEGKVRWSVGDNQGDSEEIRGCKFLCAPTCEGELLYTLVLFRESYYLLCLRSGTGETVWSSLVAQVPVQSGHMRIADSYSRGSPPALSDGMVVVATNSGVIAGVEAETGRPLWAHQYPSTVNRMGPTMPGLVRSRTGASNPPNPVIIIRGRAYCLPSDSEKLLALDCQTGELLWEVPRQGQKDLSFVDHGRLLLSGEGLLLVSTQTGETLKYYEDKGVVGRPAVSTRFALASGEAKIHRLSLAGPEYLLESMDLQSPQGLLGNLISMDGKLIASNAAGVCAYFDYDYIRKILSDRLVNANPEQTRQLLMQRGTLAFSAERFDEALSDLRRCEELARQADDNELAQRLLPHLYRTYIAMGNRSEKNEQMLERFLQAKAYAVSPSDKAHLTIRLARYYERAGQLEKAVELAQELTSEPETLKVADVAIGPEGNDLARLGPEDEKVTAADWGNTFVRRLIEIHGQKVYAAEDAKAEDAYRQARDGRSPEKLRRVADRWPNSKWVDDAQFEAAELLYLEAAQAQGVQAEQILTQTRRLLYAVSNQQSSELRVSAVVGLSAICARAGWQLVASQTLDPIRNLPPETAIKFADIQGKLGDLIKQIEAGRIGPATQPATDRSTGQIQTIAGELAQVYSVTGDQVTLLRDQDGRPVRIAQKLVALNGKRAILLDTASREAPNPDGWSALVSLDEANVNPWMMTGANLVGTLSQDGKSVVVVYRTSLRQFDLGTGKLTMDVKLGDLGTPSPVQMSITPRELVVSDSSGKIVCVNLCPPCAEVKDPRKAAPGTVRWESTLGAGKGAAMSAQIAGNCVLVRDRMQKLMLLMSLESGRVLHRFEAKSFLEGFLTAQGFVVTMVDGVLTVRETARPEKEVLSRVYAEAAGPGLLAVNSQYIVVAPNQEGQINILPIVGSGVSAAEIKLDLVAGEKALPIEAVFEGEHLYVMTTSGMPGAPANLAARRIVSANRYGSVRNLALHKLSLKKDKPLWSYAMDQSGRYMTRPTMPAIGQRHLVAVVREMQVQAAAKAVILDKETGKVVQTLDLAGQDPKVKMEVRHRRLMTGGAVVLTDGFLTVETGDGVAVYGPKQ